MVAPVGNIIISSWLSGASDWYQISAFFSRLGQIQTIDWVWLGLIFVSGVLLYIQHKTAWLVASMTLALVVAFNIYLYYIEMDNGNGIHHLKIQIVFSILVTLTALLIIFYARYPYLDRRAGVFLPVAHRYMVKTEVTVMGKDIFQGITESVSTSGARIHLQQDFGASSKMKFIDVIFPQIQNLKVKSQIIDYDGNLLRIKFKDLKGESKKQFLDWIKGQT